MVKAGSLKPGDILHGVSEFHINAGFPEHGLRAGREVGDVLSDGRVRLGTVKIGTGRGPSGRHDARTQVVRASSPTLSKMLHVRPAVKEGLREAKDSLAKASTPEPWLFSYGGS